MMWEAQQRERHDFFVGEVYARTGARARIFFADMKLHVASAVASFLARAASAVASFLARAASNVSDEKTKALDRIRRLPQRVRSMHSARPW